MPKNANLNSLLVNDGVSPANIAQLAREAATWFNLEPSAVSFAVDSMFREMERDWDPLGIPTDEAESIAQGVLPHAIKLTSGTLPEADVLSSIDLMVVGLSNAMALSRP